MEALGFGAVVVPPVEPQPASSRAVQTDTGRAVRSFISSTSPVEVTTGAVRRPSADTLGSGPKSRQWSRPLQFDTRKRTARLRFALRIRTDRGPHICH
ncbi:hypothetical protein GCM10020229_66950 [Kitasatospora albolonga]